MINFSFTNALFHFFKSEGAGAFLPRFLFLYLIVALVMSAICFVLLSPIIEFYVDLLMLAEQNSDGGVDEEDVNALLIDQASAFSGASSFLLILILPVFVGVWATFEAAIQRHYVRNEPFKLRLDNDAWRLMAVGVVVYISIFGVALLSILPMGIIAGLAGATENVTALWIGVGLGYLVMLLIITWFVARISAASALTIRDERVRIFESFAVTKRRALPIAFSLLLIWGIFYVLQWFVMGAGIFAIIGQLGDLFAGEASQTREDILIQLKSPAIIGTGSVFMALLIVTYGASMILTAGPGALAALNDPNRPFEGADPSEVFS